MPAFIQQIDERILLFIQEHLRNEFFTPILKIFTILGNYGAIWIVMILVLLLIKKYRKTALAALISLAVCFIINDLVIKGIAARARPFLTMQELQVLIERPISYSFPSGHSANSFAAAAAIFFMGKRKLGAVSLVLALIIAASRLYLGVHYPSDVLVGILLGLTVGYLTALIMKRRELISKLD